MRNREEKKCKKSQESTIGKIIYGFLLFMPLLAILVTCGYAMFNKNAYQSYSGKNDNEVDYTSITFSTTMFQEGETYLYVNESIENGASNNRLEIVPYNNSFRLNNGTYTDVTRLIWYTEGTTNYFFYSDTNGNHYSPLRTTIVEVEFTVFTYSFSAETVSNTLFDYFYQIEYNTNYYVDNVFYYSVDKVEQSNLFNWAQNSVIYTTTNATCNALSINNTFIPLLLSYWLIISVLYFLYDIALMLVWIVHRKIHDLQENF